MRVKFKRLHPDAIIPKYQTAGSAGADLHALSKQILYPRQVLLVPLGFSVSLPPNLEMQIRPRGGMAAHSAVTVLNTPGTVDSDYRGEVKVILINHGTHKYTLSKGQRIAQAVFQEVHQVRFEETEDLDETPRGGGGFGSTGRK